jgi:hypothetical protein
VGGFLLIPFRPSVRVGFDVRLGGLRLVRRPLPAVLWILFEGIRGHPNMVRVYVKGLENSFNEVDKGAVSSAIPSFRLSKQSAELGCV